MRDFGSLQERSKEHFQKIYASKKPKIFATRYARRKLEYILKKIARFWLAPGAFKGALLKSICIKEKQNFRSAVTNLKKLRDFGSLQECAKGHFYKIFTPKSQKISRRATRVASCNEF